MSSELKSLPYPEIFNNYVNIKYVAKGAYGTIYSACDRNNNAYISFFVYYIITE